MKAPIVKKVPMRKCVITGNQFPKKDLLRVVREPDGNITIDDTGKVRGHGVYLCKDADVIKAAKKKHILDRFLEVAVADEIYDELLKKVSQSE
ncbi:MAG: YlxR family protein [Bacilli bacterium]|jgi:predicted RNA-binding protein YlxR (DUF448 family)|nr:YlxR family protein [Bacilli bacterium]